MTRFEQIEAALEEIVNARCAKLESEGRDRLTDEEAREAAKELEKKIAAR